MEYMTYDAQYIFDQLKLLLPLSAGIVAVIWAASKFYYKEQKRKKEKTSHLIVKSNIERLGTKDSFYIIKFNLSVINNSDSKMYVLADYINIYGISMTARYLPEKEYLQISSEKINKKKYAFLHRYVKVKEKMLVFCGKIFNYDDYWWLEPDEKLKVCRIVYIPDSFDFIELLTTVYYSLNKDWLEVKTMPREDEKGLHHEVIINIEKYKDQKFDWHNKKHLKLHNRYRNAEINNSSLLFMK